MKTQLPALLTHSILLAQANNTLRNFSLSPREALSIYCPLSRSVALQYAQDGFSSINTGGECAWQLANEKVLE